MVDQRGNLSGAEKTWTIRRRSLLRGAGTLTVGGLAVPGSVTAQSGGTNTLVIQGQGESANYEFRVSGDLESDPTVGELEEWDTLRGDTANGWVTKPEQVDGYRFTGHIEYFTFLQNEAQVSLNGQTVDPSQLGEGSRVSNSNVITIKGKGEPANYRLSVSGALSPNTEVGGLEQWDSLNGSLVEGWVTQPTHVDSFQFTGEITSFVFLQNTAQVLLNGEQVDPGSLGTTERRSQIVTIQGRGEYANYRLVVNGDLQPNPSVGGLEKWDDLDGNSVEGWVTQPEHVDSFRVTGSIDSFVFLQNSAEVLLDDTPVNPAALSTGRQLPHVITIQGQGEPANYNLAVSGKLQSNPAVGGLEEWDTLDRNGAEGWVTHPKHIDSYRYSGDIEYFEFIEGNASVAIDGIENGTSNVSRQPSPPCLLRVFRQYADTTPDRYARLKEDLNASAKRARDNITASEAVATAMGVLETIAHINFGDYSGGIKDFLDTVAEDAQDAAELRDEPFFQSLEQYTRHARSAYDLVSSGEQDLLEFAELVEDAYEIREEQDKDSILAALELVLRTYTGTLKSKVIGVIINTAATPLDVAVEGLKMNIRLQLVLKTFAETQTPILQKLETLARMRDNEVITKEEMYGYFVYQQEYHSARHQLMRQLYSLSREGQRTSLFFKIAQLVGEALNAHDDLLAEFQERQEQAKRDYEDAAARMAQFHKAVKNCP